MNPGVPRADLKIRFEHWPVVWIWPVSLVLMQLTLLRIGDFEVSLGVVACHLLELYLILFYWLWRPPAWQIAMAALVLLYTLRSARWPRSRSSSGRASRTSRTCS